MTTRDRPPTWPDDHLGLVRRGAVPPTTEPPAEFARYFVSEPRPTKEIRRISREQAVVENADPVPDELPAYVPPWVGVAPKPQRPRFSPPPRVSLLARELDPLYIISVDNRTIFHDFAVPWGMVCKITAPHKDRGSGVLIGPRHVLTASHVVDWNTEEAETIEVQPYGATEVRARTADTLATAFVKIAGTDPGHSEVDEDYAVLTLADRLGDTFGYFGSKKYDSGWDDEGLWTTMGYPGDRGSGTDRGRWPTYQNGVSLDELAWDLGDGRAMTTNADVMPGQSGSPVFGMWDGQPYVVAVVSAQGGGDNYCAGGAELNRLIRDARQANP